MRREAVPGPPASCRAASAPLSAVAEGRREPLKRALRPLEALRAERTGRRLELPDGLRFVAVALVAVRLGVLLSGYGIAARCGLKPSSSKSRLRTLARTIRILSVRGDPSADGNRFSRQRARWFAW